MTFITAYCCFLFETSASISSKYHRWSPLAHDKFHVNKQKFASVKLRRRRSHMIAIFELILCVVVLPYVVKPHQTRNTCAPLSWKYYHPLHMQITNRSQILISTLIVLGPFCRLHTSDNKQCEIKPCSLIYNGLYVTLSWRSYSSKLNPCAPNFLQSLSQWYKWTPCHTIHIHLYKHRHNDIHINFMFYVNNNFYKLKIKICFLRW